MASITFKGRPTVALRTYQVLRIGNNEQDDSLDISLDDKVSAHCEILLLYEIFWLLLHRQSVAKLHATLTRSEKGIFLVNESPYTGSVSVNGWRFGGPYLITFRDAIDGIVNLRFGRVEATLHVSSCLGRRVADPK
ncbi:hypothetical protein KR222_003999 [Zaprionus bogoriensis]|nr:hypothetical protein KR222_003999 [Zaprionus bogoriensis]